MQCEPDMKFARNNADVRIAGEHNGSKVCLLTLISTQGMRVRAGSVQPAAIHLTDVSSQSQTSQWPTPSYLRARGTMCNVSAPMSRPL